MEKKQIDFIKSLMAKNGISIPQLAKKSKISHVTIRRMLNPNSGYNTSVETLTSLATSLGVKPSEILDATDFNEASYIGVKGFIDYRGTIERIGSFKDLKGVYDKIQDDMNAPNKAKEYIDQEAINLKTQSHEPIDVSTIDLFKQEIYDTKDVFTWSFRKSDDEKEELKNDFGNMCKGYPFKVCGEKFHNSECAYIVGLFSQNDEKSIQIQRELQVCENGYSAKKDIRQKYEKVGFHRSDWETFNVQWMLYVVWQKCTQNKDFRKKLTSDVIPPYAVIVENSTYQKGRTSTFWGAKNEELKDALDTLMLSKEVIDYKGAKKKDAVIQSRNSLNHYGTWKGVNCMGKILTICKHCLEEGIEPPIDYELLRSKNIYLFGKLLTFDNAPKTPSTPTPIKPRRGVKVHVAEKSIGGQETAFPEPTSDFQAIASQEIAQEENVAHKGSLGKC